MLSMRRDPSAVVLVLGGFVAGATMFLLGLV